MAKRRRKLRAVPPTINCLLLCDDVLISQGKGKHFLQGVIGAIGVVNLPAMIGGYVAYVRFSNVHGEQKVKLSFEPAAGGESLFEIEANFSSQSDPLGIYTLVIPVPPFLIAEAGRFMFTASHGGVPLAQSPIEIKSVRPAQEEM